MKKGLALSTGSASCDLSTQPRKKKAFLLTVSSSSSSRCRNTLTWTISREMRDDKNGLSDGYGRTGGPNMANLEKPGEIKETGSRWNK